MTAVTHLDISGHPTRRRRRPHRRHRSRLRGTPRGDTGSARNRLNIRSCRDPRPAEPARADNRACLSILVLGFGVCRAPMRVRLKCRQLRSAAGVVRPGRPDRRRRQGRPAGRCHCRRRPRPWRRCEHPHVVRPPPAVQLDHGPTVPAQPPAQARVGQPNRRRRHHLYSLAAAIIESISSSVRSISARSSSGPLTISIVRPLLSQQQPSGASGSGPQGSIG
jgi:hypothetical protein